MLHPTSPIISIIMPVYNTEEFLRECLASITNQTFKDWELIAVDDFSTDGSREILEEFSINDERIRWLANCEKGIIPALELAYKNSTGNLIHRMDSDDIMPLDKLETLYNIHLSNPQAVITGSVSYFSTGKEMKRGFLDYADWLNLLNVENTHFANIYYECPLASPAWLIPRIIIEKIGGITSGIYPEDYDLIFRLYKHQIPIIGTEKVVHLWRDHNDRASRTQEVYQDQNFFDLKLRYFNQIDRDTSRRLVLWGAGRKGKQLYEHLPLHESFTWVDNHPGRWNKHIREKMINKPEIITLHDQVVIAVSSPVGKAEIISHLKTKGMQNNVDYFVFC